MFECAHELINKAVKLYSLYNKRKRLQINCFGMTWYYISFNTHHRQQAPNLGQFRRIPLSQKLNTQVAQVT